MQNFPISSIKDLEFISHKAKWQYFEKLVAWIFEQNDYDSKQNVVIKTPAGKRQFDVIAAKYDKIFLVECKKWKSRSQRAYAMKSAARKHLERCDLYSLNDIGADRKAGRKIIPLIVTLLEEEIAECENIPVVPVMKLDWFLNNSDSL